MVRDAKTMQIIEIQLYCPICKTHTKHVLNRSGKAFVCGCGNEQEYHVSLPETKGKGK